MTTIAANTHMRESCQERPKSITHVAYLLYLETRSTGVCAPVRQTSGLPGFMTNNASITSERERLILIEQSSEVTDITVTLPVSGPSRFRTSKDKEAHTTCRVPTRKDISTPATRLICLEDIRLPKTRLGILAWLRTEGQPLKQLTAYIAFPITDTVNAVLRRGRKRDGIKRVCRRNVF